MESNTIIGAEMAQRWLVCKNGSSTTIPAYAPVEIVGTASIASGGLAYTVQLPSADSMAAIGVNGPTRIQPGNYGRFTLDWPALCLVDTTDSPTFGATFGTATGSNVLDGAQTGFELISDAIDTNKFMVRPLGQAYSGLFAVSDTISAGSGTEQVVFSTQKASGGVTQGTSNFTILQAGAYLWGYSMSIGYPGSASYSTQVSLYVNSSQDTDTIADVTLHDGTTNFSNKPISFTNTITLAVDDVVDVRVLRSSTNALTLYRPNLWLTKL